MENKRLINEMIDALASILNVEHAALIGATFPASQGLDVAHHFDKVRAALAHAEQNGFSIE